MAVQLSSDEVGTIITIVSEAIGAGAPLVEKLFAMKAESDAAMLAEASSTDAATRAEIDADAGKPAGS
jgi:hypothetical protein